MKADKPMSHSLEPVKGPKSARRALERISRASGQNEKMKLLKAYDSPIFRKILLYALDPYRRFGVQKIRPELTPENLGEPSCESDAYSFKEILSVLDRLADRKITGHDALRLVNDVIQSTPEWADTFTKILLKDLRCGLQAKTVNKVFPNLVPVFEVMRAKDFEDYEHKVKYPLLGEIKMDGIRITSTICEGELLEFQTRNGLRYLDYQHIKDQLAEASRALGGLHIVDGELMVERFSGRQGRKKFEAQTKYIIFDMLTLEEWVDLSTCKPQQIRTKRISLWFDKIRSMGIEVPNLTPSTCEILNDRTDVENMYLSVVNSGGEGLMLKNLNGKYERKRSQHWMKYKPTYSVDLEIVDVEEGTGQFEGNLGAIVVEFWGPDEDNPYKKPVRVNVGSGFSTIDRYKMWKQRKELIGQVAEIEYKMVTPDGSLLHSVFKRMRPDK